MLHNAVTKQGASESTISYLRRRRGKGEERSEFTDTLSSFLVISYKVYSNALLLTGSQFTGNRELCREEGKGHSKGFFGARRWASSTFTPCEPKQYRVAALQQCPLERVGKSHDGLSDLLLCVDRLRPKVRSTSKACVFHRIPRILSCNLAWGVIKNYVEE